MRKHLFQKLCGHIQDERKVARALDSLLDALRIPAAHKPIVSSAILRQAQAEPKGQYPYLSHAVLAVVSKYRVYSRRVPLRGFHLLWYAEHLGWRLCLADHTLSMLRDLQGWIDGLLDETDTHRVYVSPLALAPMEVWERLLEQGILSQKKLESPFSVPRDAWIHQMMVRIFKWYGTDFKMYGRFPAPITLSTRLLSNTIELFGLVVAVASEEGQGRSVTPDFFTELFEDHSLSCWRVCLHCRSASEQINHSVIMYLLKEHGIAWLNHLLGAFENGQVDALILEALVAYEKMFSGKSWEEIWPALLKWRHSGKSLDELPKMFMKGVLREARNWKDPAPVGTTSYVSDVTPRGRTSPRRDKT